MMHIGDLYQLKSNKTVFKKKYCKSHKHFIDTADYKAHIAANGQNNEENDQKNGQYDNQEE